MPPAGAGTATLRERPLSVEEIDLDRARSEAVLSKKPKSKLSVLRKQDEPCAGGCPAHAISRAGSNSYVVKTTCMLCGHKTAEPRPKAIPKKVYEECEHAREDYRGSTHSVHKVYCLDCCTYIEEVPQRLRKAGKELAGKVQDLPLGQQDLTRRQLDEVEFTSMEAGSIIKQFVKYWDKRLCRVQSVTSTELSSVLMDMIDDHRPQPGSASASASAAAGVSRSESAPRTTKATSERCSSPAPRTPPRVTAAVPKRSPERRGYMAAAEKGDAAEHAPQGVHVTQGTGQDSFVEPSLPLVDPLEDNTSIYVMLDEGCNTTCHGKGWRLHAERILANHGMQLLQVSEVPESSSGTSTDTGVEAGAADTTAAASALVNIAEAAFANLADYSVVISEAMPGTEKYEDFRAFFSDRLEEPAVKEWKKRKASYVKKQKEKNGKLLDYAKCSDELKRKLDETRAKEWSKWKEFGASVVIDSKQLQELLDEGHQVIPTQWVELDKNCNKRLVDPTVEEKLKSRLVVRGDLEKGDPRSDSPTASLEAQNMVFSFTASRRLKIKCLDVTNAYFQGEEIDRVLLLSQPKGLGWNLVSTCSPVPQSTVP